MAIEVLGFSTYQSRSWVIHLYSNREDSMSTRKKIYCALITLIAFAPWAHAAVPMPEPSAISMIGVDLLCVGALVVLFRRRSPRDRN